VFNSDALSGGKTDQQLWKDIHNGDELSFTLLFERYHRTLYNYGCKLTANSTIVEDAVQDVFIDVWRLRRNLTENVSSVKFYLYRALRRRIHVAHGKFPLTEELTSLDGHEISSGLADSEIALIENESKDSRAKRVRRLLLELPDRQVEALTLRYFDDFGIDEIALIMGVSEKSVRNFIYKALTSLRQSRQVLIISCLIFCLLVLY
jgi:RNA polymerase sigma factor (sigma-70 family)